MLKTLSLLLPAFIPSWRFFDMVGDAPRIEYRLPDAAPDEWRVFRPRPARLSPADIFKRLLWNAPWNETLFLVSCAERLMLNPTAHSRDEIARRIGSDLLRGGARADSSLQFRLVFIGRRDGGLHEDIEYVSPVYPRPGGGVA